MIKIIFLSSLLLFLDTTSFSQQTKHAKKYYFQGDTSRYAILKFNKSCYWIFKNAKPATLTRKEIELTEILLKTAIKEHNQNIKNVLFNLKELKNYKRQLIPVINRKGEKEV